MIKADSLLWATEIKILVFDRYSAFTTELASEKCELYEFFSQVLHVTINVRVNGRETHKLKKIE